MPYRTYSSQKPVQWRGAGIDEFEKPATHGPPLKALLKKELMQTE